MSFRVYSIPESRFLSSSDNAFLSPDGDLYQWKRAFLSFGKIRRLSFTDYKYHNAIGICDKKYVDIHEGDICKLALPLEDKEVVGVISFAEELCGYIMLDDIEMHFYPIEKSMSPYIEVIGNVLQNADLLPRHAKEITEKDVDTNE